MIPDATAILFGIKGPSQYEIRRHNEMLQKSIYADKFERIEQRVKELEAILKPPK